MSGTKRKSTVHDFSSLRLHPDGTRVASTNINRSLRNAKYAVQDRRGNWIAKDAGGLGQVKKRRTTRMGEDDHGAQTGEGSADVPVGSSSKNNSGKGKARDLSDQEGAGNDEESEVRDLRALRRKLFTDDLDFLRPMPTSVATADIEKPSYDCLKHNSAGTVPDLTSDLLKCVHYFASTYYSEMGQLRDYTREYRKEKKSRRIEQLKAEEASARTSQERSFDPSQTHSANQDSEEVDEDNDEKFKVEAEEVIDGRKQPRNRGPRRRKGQTGTDMYKIFDGSALMAIGLLLQEYVSAQVSTKVPKGWEEEMLRAQGLDACSMNGGRRKGRWGRKKRSRRPEDQEEASTTEYEGDKDDTDALMSIPSDENETRREPLSERWHVEFA